MGFMQQFQQGPNQTELRARMAQLRQMMQGDSTALIGNLARSNPQFAQFMAQNRGRTPEDAFRAYGYDYDEVMKIVNS